MGRYTRTVILRKYEFERRNQLIAFLEDNVTLDSVRQFVQKTIRPAPRLYIQVRKVIEKEDKPLPTGAVIPEDPPSVRQWDGGDDTVSKFQSTAAWAYLDMSV